MTRFLKGAVVIAIAALLLGIAGNSQSASAANGQAPSAHSEDSEIIWQIGIFDSLKHEFGFDFLDNDFVCDSPPPDGPGEIGRFIVGLTPTYSFPSTISTSDAPESDERFDHSCNSVTIEFEIPDGTGYEDVKLRYSRMGGEADALVVDGDHIGIAGQLSEDPHPAKDYLFNLDTIGAGVHTIQIIGQERTPCDSGTTCRDGLVDGYHFIDALSLSGEKFDVDDDGDEAEIDIDIRPGSRFNIINPRSRGKIMVAILSSSGFDAEDVDVDSVRFGPDRAHRSHNRVVFHDVNRDGYRDLILHFNTYETGIECGDTSVFLEGETEDGLEFEGSDSIMTVGCNGRGPDKDKDKEKHDKDKDKDQDSDDDNDVDNDGDDNYDDDDAYDEDDDDNPGRGRGRGRGNDDDGDHPGKGRGRGHGNDDDGDHPGRGHGKDKDKGKD